MMDDAALGRLMRCHQENTQRIMELRDILSLKVSFLQNLLGALEQDPATISVLDNGGLFLPMGATVDCDMLKEMGTELSELKEISLKDMATREQLKRLGF